MTLVSVWQDRRPRTAVAPGAASETHYEVAVVGAGLAGVTTALLLARAGRSVVLLEAGAVGRGTTARSTAKLSALQGTRLSTIAGSHAAPVVKMYADAQVEAVEWVARFCDDHGIAAQRRDALTYANSAMGERQLREELEATQGAGLATSWVDEPTLPFHTRGAVRLSDQLQVDPLELLLGLLDQALAHGVELVEGARVVKVRGSAPVTLSLQDSDAVQADRVVVATGTPILDRGAFFARLEPSRSYSVAFRTPAPAVDAMYLSADSPSRSLRDAPDGDGSLLLVGGNGHRVGAKTSAAKRLDQLREWTHQYWPDAVETHAWSAQDYIPHHQLPWAGPVLPRSDISVLGGFAKWGMTNAVAGAHVLASDLLGGERPWADAFRTWSRHETRGLLRAGLLNAEVGLEMARGWGGALATRSVTEDGLSRVCTHLGGITRWNDAERSWDCPLHGSRFDRDGEVLDGPAVCGLRKVSPQA